MKRIHIIGRKNSGKTELIVELVTELTRLGYRVGTIKHTHHDHELDTPGKDSHRHRRAGSSAVGILSKGMNAVFWPASIDPTDSRESNSDKYEQFDSTMNDCEIVLVEGDSKTNAAKIEVFREACGGPAMAMSDPTIRAIVTDDDLNTEVPIWKRSDLAEIVRKIELLLVPSSA